MIANCKYYSYFITIISGYLAVREVAATSCNLSDGTDLECGLLVCCGNACCQKGSDIWALWFLWISMVFSLLIFISILYFFWRWKKQRDMNRVIALAHTHPPIPVYDTQPPTYTNVVNGTAPTTLFSVPPQAYGLAPPECSGPPSYRSPDHTEKIEQDQANLDTAQVQGLNLQAGEMPKVEDLEDRSRVPDAVNCDKLPPIHLHR